MFAPPQVAIRRKPRTGRERLVDDTPLRFVVNHDGVRWLTLAALGYVLFVLVVTSL